jgi:hypothetical protein
MWSSFFVIIYDNGTNISFFFHCKGAIFSGHRRSRRCHWQHACKVSIISNIQPLQEAPASGLFLSYVSLFCEAFLFWQNTVKKIRDIS